MNFVDARAGRALRPAPATSPSGDAASTSTSDARRGFLGLASFLTVDLVLVPHGADAARQVGAREPAVRGDRAAAAERARSSTTRRPTRPTPQSLNVRERLAEHRENPPCAACHTILDPIGLGLENFDAIGRYRSEYANGDAIDASGMLPDGATLQRPRASCRRLLADDARLPDCASEKLLTYALSRQLVAERPAVPRRSCATQLDARRA